MSGWIQPDESVREFIRKYPLSVECFGDARPDDDVTMQEYAQQKDMDLDTLEEEMARRLTEQATGHEDCTVLCFSTEFCNKKQWISILLSILLIAGSIYYFI